MYLDESGIYSSLYRQYARSRRGTPVISDVSGKKSVRTSIISGWLHTAKEFIAPFVFEGYTDNVRFNQWLEKCLFPTLGKGWTLILDNASFHKKARTFELAQKFGCKLLFLPPYSPDLNPIEKQWAHLKTKYRTFKQRGFSHDQALDASFLPLL